MNARGYRCIPNELCYWITFLCKALPPRSIATFIELLIGAMLTSIGFVTDAYLMLNMYNHWTSYYRARAMLGQFGDDNDADRQGARGAAVAFPTDTQRG